MEKLAGRGYKRPGMVMEGGRDARLKHKWSAGFTSWFRELRCDPPVPLLLHEKITREDFQKWFKQYRPDVVIGHMQKEITVWLEEAGIPVPEATGFFQLNWTERSAPCAGIDQQPVLLGGAAVEAVIAQHNRHEKGIPLNPKTITLAGRWVDGPTLRALA